MKKKLPFSVVPFILPLNHSKRVFEALPWLQKAKTRLAFPSVQAISEFQEGFVLKHVCKKAKPLTLSIEWLLPNL